MMVENEIIERLNKHTDLLRQILDRFEQVSKQKTIEEDWYDSADSMRILKISKRSLYRLREKYPQECRRVAGKFYYNLTALLKIKPP